MSSESRSTRRLSLEELESVVHKQRGTDTGPDVNAKICKGRSIVVETGKCDCDRIEVTSGPVRSDVKKRRQE